MRWGTKRTDEFDEWWGTLTETERGKVSVAIHDLEEKGPWAGRPLVDAIKGSKHPNMKELRPTQTIRVFFAFDPRRKAVLLIGGDKAGKAKRFYRQMVTKADKIYDAHLRRIEEGVSKDGAQ
ncbi:MAG TPA: type II toxin-antitoxin system RelE/ParE family toxin [Solirubrobacterales bacterium]|nr:type II toxin-antitoxin system RelE/ParE family toxin [Solirubrobacterales bacterium]